MMNVATTGLTPAELDELFTGLWVGLAAAGQERTPMILARLALLLMHEVGDAERVAAAVTAALRED